MNRATVRGDTQVAVPPIGPINVRENVTVEKRRQAAFRLSPRTPRRADSVERGCGQSVQETRRETDEGFSIRGQGVNGFHKLLPSLILKLCVLASTLRLCLGSGPET